jgi:hypothetical protein
MASADFESVMLRKHVMLQLGVVPRSKVVAGRPAKLIYAESFFCDIRGDQRFLNYDVYRLLSAALTEALLRLEDGPFVVEFLPAGKFIELRISDPRVWTPSDAVEPPTGCWPWPSFLSFSSSANLNPP